MVKKIIVFKIYYLASHIANFGMQGICIFFNTKIGRTKNCFCVLFLPFCRFFYWKLYFANSDFK